MCVTLSFFNTLFSEASVFFHSSNKQSINQSVNEMIKKEKERKRQTSAVDSAADKDAVKDEVKVVFYEDTKGVGGDGEFRDRECLSASTSHWKLRLELRETSCLFVCFQKRSASHKRKRKRT